jgi:ketosteroid isomerase-like protein
MMRAGILLLASALALAACQQQAAEADANASLSEAEAEAVVDAAQSDFASADIDRIDALYAGNVVAFDPRQRTIGEGSVMMYAFNVPFASLGYDEVEVADRKIQVLDADTLVVSGTAQLSSSTGASKDKSMRYTQVFQKQADGAWKIATQHLSEAPA